MKKVSVCMVVLVVLASVFAITVSVRAGSPEPASGLWLYTPYITGAKEAGCNSHLSTFEESEWSGTFFGTSTEEGRVIVHCNGNWSFKATVYFDDVTVNGRSGTLEMTTNGTRPDATADWFGHWTITKGTGELENLRGHGTFWGPGAPAPEVQGTIYYAGNIHFEPNY